MSGNDGPEVVTRAGEAWRRYITGLKTLLATGLVVLVALFRNEILEILRTTSVTIFGFVVLGIGLASLIYFLIPIIWDIEEIKADIDDIKETTRNIRRNLRPDGGTTLDYYSGNKLIIMGIVSGMIGGASLGLLIGRQGAVIGMVLGAPFGFFIARQMVQRKVEEKKEDVALGYSTSLTDFEFKRITDFSVALISSDGEIFTVEGERDAILNSDLNFEKAFFAISLPWWEEEDVVSLYLESTPHRSRSMGDEILYYGTLRLTDPESHTEAELEFDFREYPAGHFDLFEIQTYGPIEILEISEYLDDIREES